MDDGSSGSAELVADLALATFLGLLLSFTPYAPVVRDIIFVTFFAGIFAAIGASQVPLLLSLLRCKP